MKKIGVLNCISGSATYSFVNIKSISILVLQIFAATIIPQWIIGLVSETNLFSLVENNDPTQMLSAGSTVILFFSILWGMFLSVALKLSISRNIVLGEPFTVNLLTLVQQKRYWYCFWASLKMFAAIYLIYVLLSFALVFVNAIILAIFVLILALFGVAVSFTNPSISAFVESLSSIALITIITIGIILSIFLIVSDILICGSVLVSFIYVSLLAALDRTAKFSTSWKLMKGNRLRMLGVMLFLLIATSLLFAGIKLPLSYLTTGSFLRSPPWLVLFENLLGLYLFLPLTVAIALSYRSLLPDGDKNNT